MSLTASQLTPETALFRHVIPAGEPYLFEVKAGQTLRLLDLEGNQAVDTLFYSAANPRERYDPQRNAAPPGQDLPDHRQRALFQSGQSAADHRGRHLRPP